MNIMALNGQLGYGFSIEALQAGFDRGPDVIGVDAGSTDGGPFYLGHGRPMVSRDAVYRDLDLSLPTAVRAGIPFIIGSAGTGGARVHVEWTRRIIEDIAAEHGLSFRLAVIHADIDPDQVLTALKNERIRCVHPPVRVLTEEAVRSTTRIVAQMGTGPFIRALDAGADVILAGRACDTAIFASPAIRAGYDPGLAFHMGKIAECGTHCAEPGTGADCLWVEMSEDHFTVEPLHVDKYCTPVSTAAHSLYEQEDPYVFHEPEGEVDASAARFEAVDGRTVRISGSRFRPANTVRRLKIEGSRLIGYRTITPAGARDPAFISRLDSIGEQVRSMVRERISHRVPDSWRLKFRYYGRDGVMGEQEPLRGSLPHEVGVIIEALADSQEAANAVCALARSSMLHVGYPGRQSTAGNLALPYSPADLPMGPAYEFSIYHLMEVDDLVAPFPMELVDLGVATHA